MNERKSKVENSSPPRAKLRVFAPRLEASGQFELSTFCVDQLEEPERWVLLDAHSDKPVVGRSELPRSVFVDVGLEPVADWDPERHVNVVGWPAAEEARVSIGQRLHAAQVFVLRP